MELKPRSRWKKNRSIVAGRRSARGQIAWKGKGPDGDVFLVRVGKDASRQLTGTKQDALRALEQLIEEVRGGDLSSGDGKLRFDTWLDKFLEERRRRVRPSTYLTYSNAIEVRVKPGLGMLRLDAIRPDHVQKWLDSLMDDGLSEKTIRNYVALAKAALQMAYLQGAISTNPAKSLDFKTSREQSWYVPQDAKVKGEGVDVSRVWSTSEMQTFFEEAPLDHEMTRYVKVGVRTGLRAQEQCGLRWTEVDLEGAIVKVRTAVVQIDKALRAKYGRWSLGYNKTKKFRNVSLPPDAVEALRVQRRYVGQLLAEGKITEIAATFVFPLRGKGLTQQGPDRPKGYNSPDNIRDRLRFFVLGRKDRPKQKGLKEARYICPYGLRHTHATDLIRCGWTIFMVAKRLGTSQLMVEKHYGHLLPDVEPDMSKMSPLKRGGEQ